MDIEELVTALDPLQPAHHACAAALRRGARFALWQGGLATPDELLWICRRRHARLLEQGTETIGFDQALEALRSTGYDTLRLGAVEVDEPPYHYPVFLAPDQVEVVACLGVDQSVQQADS